MSHLPPRTVRALPKLDARSVLKPLELSGAPLTFDPRAGS
jgi:hypothetical protein